jgi:hypothetical protein
MPLETGEIIVAGNWIQLVAR